MSKRSISWIDPSHLAQLVSRVEGGRRGTTPRPQSPGISAARPKPVVPALTLDTIRAATAPEGPTPEGTAPEGFTPPEGDIEVRLQAFTDWMSRCLDGGPAFVSDLEGLTLASRGAEADLVAVASALEGSWRTVRSSLSSVPINLQEPGPLRVELAPGRHLFMIEGAMRESALLLGWLASKADDGGLAQRFRDHFRRTIEEGEKP